MSRVDRETGAAHKGSQRHVQAFLSTRAAELDPLVLEHLPDLDGGSEIDWRSPRDDDRYNEYYDCAFLERLGLDEYCGDLTEFWPRGGPHWDGLGVARTPNGELTYLLVEGKSYPGEMRSTCEAKPSSKRLIEESLSNTKSLLGADDTPLERWTNGYYQLANRLAHVAWMRETLGVNAWLVNVLFAEDVGHVSTSSSKWDAAIEAAYRHLGMSSEVADEYAIDICLKP